MRINDHPIFGPTERGKKITIIYNQEPIEAYEGETIAAALWASGKRVAQHSQKLHAPRGLFCAIGYCSDCLMVVDGVPGVRTCVVMAKDGMSVEVQDGFGHGGAVC